MHVYFYQTLSKTSLRPLSKTKVGLRLKSKTLVLDKSLNSARTSMSLA